MKKNQTLRTVLAVVFMAAFLVTGKMFVWPEPDAANAQNGKPDISEMSSAENALTSEVTTVTTTVTTTTVTTTITDHFELVPPKGAESTEESTVLTDAAAETTETEAVTEPAETEEPADAQQIPADIGNFSSAPDGYFNDALFIGDSRTVGQAFYAPIDGATYFATVGLGAYKMDGALSEVPGTEGLDFATVLSMKQYGKVYIMLGINELGNDLSYSKQNFLNLIDRVKAAQPNAVIYLEANLHVAASRHNSDNVVNNTVINNFNAMLSELADGVSICYIDVNPIFDDAQGCLTQEYTSDGTHPYAKHYAEWQAFIMNHVAV